MTCENPKSEFPNPKWFDELTTLSEAEGQFLIFQIQMTKTIHPCNFLGLNI